VPPRRGRLAGLLLALATWTAAVAAPGDGAAITLGMALEPPNLDPTLTSAEATEDVVYGNLFEGLTRILEDGSVAPALAARWSVSADGLSYRFELRRGVRFHDGTPLTPLDVVYSLERARATGSTNPLHDLLAHVARVAVEDEHAVSVRLDEPVADLLTYLGWGNLVIMSAASAGGAATHPVGTGPFRFGSWRKGESIVLLRNPDYWGPPARLARVTFRFLADPGAALAALLAGDVDGFPNLGVPERIAALARDPRFTVAVGSTEGETLLAINNARAPFTDLRVRRALAMAIDRRAVIEGAMYGYGTPIGSHFAPHHPAYVDLTGRYPHDPAAARRLLAAAGYPHGFAVTLRLPPPYYARRSGEIIAAQLGAVGIRVTLENVEWAQWLERVFRDHDFDLTVVAHTEPLDYDIYARKGYYFGYSSPAYDALLARLSRTTDPAARRALLGDVQRRLAEDAVNVFLFELPKLGVWRRDLHGLWREAPVQGIDVTRAWLEPAAVGTGQAARADAAPLGVLVVAAALAALALGGVALARHASPRLLLGRLTGLLVTLAFAAALVFLLTGVLPGDPAAYMMGLNASPASVAALHRELGLDAPALARYAAWIGALAHGDLGTSYTYRVPVADLVAARLAVSVPLAALSLALTLALALPLALGAAARGRRARALAGGLLQLGLAIPNFWLGLLLLSVFAVGLGWLPAGGFPGWDRGAGTALAALTLPALALALPQACLLARVLANALDEALAEDYARTARAKGLGRGAVLLRHALPNALVPALTVAGLQFAFLLGGSILVETVFALPGVGRLVLQATEQRDLVVVRSVVLLMVGAVVVVNFLVDLAHAAIDPRLRAGRAA
jgi:ABC-type transport system substrate-binding protein/ABC-type dipeptide/oligopeptide/nickel transport system permease component